MALRNDWAWQPDGDTLAALARGAQKMRRAGSRSSGSIINEETKVATKKASKKVEPKAAKAKGKKLDGKALAAKRKPGDSVAQYIKDALNAGKSDVDKILEGAKKEFPKANPTRGYVRWIAKGIGKAKLVAAPAKAEKPAKAKSAAKKAAPKKDADPKADKPAAGAEPDPAS